MKKVAFAVAVAFASINAAHAQSILPRVEFGTAYQWSKDMGDGTWIQEGAPNNHEQTNGAAFIIGLTGRIWTSGRWSSDYHIDYVYYGQQSASVDGVPDDQYDAVHHRIVNYQGERYSPFNGQGHVQGIPVTLDIGYTYNGVRFAVEGGAWEYWNTWHESLYDLANQWVNYDHITKAQTGFVVGARVEYKDLSLSYRYYQVKQQWNPSPGLVTGTNMIALTYKW